MSEQEKSGGGIGKWVLGCGIALVAGIVLCGGGAWFVVRATVPIVKEAGADAFVAGMEDAVDQLSLPEDEAERLMFQVERLAEAFKRGDVTLKEAGQLFERTFDGPIGAVGWIYYYETRFQASDEFTDIEHQHGVDHIRRYARGVWDNVIPINDVDRTLGRNLQGKQKGGETVWEDPWEQPGELRRCMLALVKSVETYGIPKDTTRIDLAQEFENEIDRLLVD